MPPKAFSSCLIQGIPILLAKALTLRNLVQDLSQKRGITALLWLDWAELGKHFSLPLRCFSMNFADLIIVSRRLRWNMRTAGVESRQRSQSSGFMQAMLRDLNRTTFRLP